MKKFLSLTICMAILITALSSCGSFTTMSKRVERGVTPETIRLYKKNNKTFILNVMESDVKDLDKEDIILDQYFKDFSVEKIEFVNDALSISISGNLGERTIASDAYTPNIGTITIPANKTKDGTHITSKVTLDIPHLKVSPSKISEEKEIAEKFKIKLENDALKDFVNRNSLELRGAFSNCVIRSMRKIDNSTIVIKVAGDPDYTQGSGVINIPSRCTKSGLGIDVPIQFITDTKLFSFNTVPTQSKTNTYISLRVSGDNFNRNISPNNIKLDGLFKDLEVSKVYLQENNSVLSLKLTGEGITNTGTGTITLDKKALKNRKEASINIPVQSPKISSPSVLWASPETIQTYDIKINANSPVFSSSVDKDIISNYEGLSNFKIEDVTYFDSSSIELRIKATTYGSDTATLTIDKKYIGKLNDISFELPIYDKINILGQVELGDGLSNMEIIAYNSKGERINNVAPVKSDSSGNFILKVDYSDLNSNSPLIHLEANGKTRTGGMKQIVSLSSDILLKNDSVTEKHHINVPTTLASKYMKKNNTSLENSITAVKTYFSLIPKKVETEEQETPTVLNTDVSNFNHYSFITYSRSNNGVNSYINKLFKMLQKNDEETRLKEIGRKFILTNNTPLEASENIKDGALKGSYDFEGLDFLQQKAFSNSFRSLIRSKNTNISGYLNSLKTTSEKLRALHNSVKNISSDPVITTYFDELESEYNLIEKLFTEYTYLVSKKNTNTEEFSMFERDFMQRIESSNLKEKLESLQKTLLTNTSNEFSTLEAISLYFYQLYPYEHLSAYQLRRYSSFFSAMQLKAMLLINEYDYYRKNVIGSDFSNTVEGNITTQIRFMPSSDKVDIKRDFKAGTTTATGYYVKNNFNGTTFFLATMPKAAKTFFTQSEYDAVSNIKQFFAYRDWQRQPKYIDTENYGWRTVRNEKDVKQLLQGKNFMYKKLPIRTFFTETINEAFKPYKWLYLDEPYGEFGEDQEVYDVDTNEFKHYNNYRFSENQDFEKRNLWFIFRTR